MTRKTNVAALAGLALLALPAAAAPPTADAPTSMTFLIVNPAGRGNQGMAEGFLADLSAALSAAWPESASKAPLSGRYHVTEADALASVRREKPAFAILSPGFYLAHRKTLDLRPLLVPRRAAGEPLYRVIGRDGADAATPPRVGGQAAGEPAWLIGAVLGPDRAWLGAGEPTLTPVARTLEALRLGEQGKLDYVVVHDDEWSLLQRTGKATGWKIVHSSQPLPDGPVVSFGEPGAIATGAASALQHLADSPSGRKVLERMSLSGFAPATADLWSDAARRVAGTEPAP